jgi:hypothetical protein
MRQEESARFLKTLQVGSGVAETAAQRVYLVRLARGDGVREPEKQEEFAKALTKAAARLKIKRNYDPATVSRMETGKRGLDFDDGLVVAALDPLDRGAPWVGYGVPTIKGPPKEAAPDSPNGAPIIGTVTSPPGPRRGVDELATHERSHQLADRQKAKRKGRRRRA